MARRDRNARILMNAPQCKCGYIFEHSVSVRRQRYKSYAVIDDGDYQRFLKAEVRLLRARGLTAKLRATAQSAKYVGLLLECPNCRRVRMIIPGEETDRSYLRDD